MVFHRNDIMEFAITEKLVPATESQALENNNTGDCLHTDGETKQISEDRKQLLPALDFDSSLSRSLSLLKKGDIVNITQMGFGTVESVTHTTNEHGGKVIVLLDNAENECTDVNQQEKRIEVLLDSKNIETSP